MPTFSRLLLVCATFITCGTPARAGMPSVTLSDVARMRVQTISFFLAVLLLSAWLVKGLWNSLRKDFTSLPRLTYGKALSVVVLWGLLFVLVLTMISGARELMTPGAWEKQGLTYKLAQAPATPPEENDPDGSRRKQIEALRTVLWEYAQTHEGRFPASATENEIPAERWLAPGSAKLRYLYAGGLTADRGRSTLAYEPGAYGARRLVLLTDGSIAAMSLDEIVAALNAEGR